MASIQVSMPVEEGSPDGRTRGPNQWIRNARKLMILRLARDSWRRPAGRLALHSLQPAQYVVAVVGNVGDHGLAGMAVRREHGVELFDDVLAASFIKHQHRGART